MTALLPNVPEWGWDATLAASISKEDVNTNNFVPDDLPYSIVNVNSDYCVTIGGDYWRWDSRVTLHLMKRGGTVTVRDPDTGVLGTATATADYALHTVASFDIPNSLPAHQDQSWHMPRGLTLIKHNGSFYVFAFVLDADMSSTDGLAHLHVWVYELTLAGEASAFSYVTDTELFQFPNQYYPSGSSVKGRKYEIGAILNVAPDGANPRVLVLGDTMDDQNATGFTRAYTSDYFASMITFFPADNGGPELVHTETLFGNAMTNGTSSYIAPVIGADHIDANTVAYIHLQQNDGQTYAQFLDLTTMTLINQLPGVMLTVEADPRRSQSRRATNVVATGPNVPNLLVYSYFLDPAEVPPFGYNSLRSKGTMMFRAYTAAGLIHTTTVDVPAQYADTSTVTGTMHGTDGKFIGTDGRTPFCQLDANGRMLAIAYGYPEWTAGGDPDYNWADLYSYEFTVSSTGSIVLDLSAVQLIKRRASLDMNNGSYVQFRPQLAAFTPDYIGLIVDPTYWDYGAEPVAGQSPDWNGFDYHMDVLTMYRLPPSGGGGGTSSAPPLLPPGPLWLNTSLNARPDRASTKFKGAS